MPLISYAQNFEDIMLWRALKHVSNGFYIDVGANDPTVDSVTRAFYDRGWHGINIEPMQQYQKRLRIERPSDINLALAVGDSEGELTFYDIEDTGLSTMDAEIAAGHVAKGKAVRERPVQLLRLDSICRQYVSGPIHFLKIDVEGFEDAVLRGMDFNAFRPWILVIEATLPQTQTRNTDAWQAMVLGADYRFAYFDGLNDFYVAAEHAELLPAFAVAPNYFDEFTLRPGHYYSAPVTELEHEVRQLTSNLADAMQTLHDANVWGQAVDRAFKESREHSAARIAQLEAENAALKAHIDGAAAMAAEQHAALSAHYEAHAQHAAAAIAHASAYAEDLSLHIARQREHTAHFEQLYHQTAAVVASLYASTSWRITRPIRVAKRWAADPRQALSYVRRKLVPAAPAVPAQNPAPVTSTTPAVPEAAPAAAASEAALMTPASSSETAASGATEPPRATAASDTLEQGEATTSGEAPPQSTQAAPLEAQACDLDTDTVTDTDAAPASAVPEPLLPASVAMTAQALQRAVDSTSSVH